MVVIKIKKEEAMVKKRVLLFLQGCIEGFMIHHYNRIPK